jgi:ribosomal protein S21
MKTKVSKLGILKHYKMRSRYEKPSEKRVRLKKANIINSLKNKRKREKYL